MPYGEPQGPSGHQYSLTFDSVAQIDGYYPVKFQVSVSTEYVGNEAVPGIVQSFVDMVSASPDFVLSSAVRRTQYTENLTPSPEA